MSRRTLIVYGFLLAAWIVILGWQMAEHKRVQQSARAGLINRAKDISDTLGLVLRSQRRFGGVVSKERLESALRELVQPGELEAIALLNAAGDVVASAGAPIEFPPGRVAQAGEYWGAGRVTLLNLVDLGIHLTQDLEHINPTIVVSREGRLSPETGRPPRPAAGSNAEESNMALDDETSRRPPSSGRFLRRGPPDGRFGFGRPGWMSEQEYESLIQNQGVHSFVMVMSTEPLLAAASQDFWLRMFIGLLATISVAGCAVAWRNLVRSSDLQIRLVRASELNSHLKEMNLAAAGLAHETRNPLNIIRGLAQMISKSQAASPEVRGKSLGIIDETDRVTAQLNEFINYSRPRELRASSVPVHAMAPEVIQTLDYDIAEKEIAIKVCIEPTCIQADEQLLRQALFNLLINAIQAVDARGEIIVRTSVQNGSEATLEVVDNGPGVPPEHRLEIFKPYFTTHQMGTGLGLAIVQQIVLAHGWEVEFVPNDPKGSIFRITHIKLAKR